MKVPAKLRGFLGRSKVVQPLHTSDLKEANERKWAYVASIKAEFAQALKAMASGDPLKAEAVLYRLQNPDRDEAGGQVLSDKVSAVGKRHGWHKASEFLELAKGVSTPFDFYEDRFLAHKAEYRTKSIGDFKRVLGWLSEWCSGTKQFAFIEDLDREVAGQFIERHLTKGRSSQKAKAYMAFLREYWKWMKMRGIVSENPWVDQVLPNGSRARRDAELDGGKRPFTDQEVSSLIYGPATGYLPDLMRLAALSGMRIEEICQLRVRDCSDENFVVQQGKTINARRVIPQHSDLAKLVERRTKGKGPEDYLLHELPEVPKSRDTRSDPASKQFTRYRRKQGVDERPNDKAKSNVDFHSFRRYFIKQARDGLETARGAYSPWTIANIVGHDDEGVKDLLKLTMAHYAGPASEHAKRACVEAVNLPAQQYPSI